MRIPFPQDYPIGATLSLFLFPPVTCTVRFYMLHSRTSLFKFSNPHTHTHVKLSSQAHAKLRAHTYARERMPESTANEGQANGAARIPTAHTRARRLGNGSLTGRNVNRNSLARAADAVSEPAFASRYTITRGLNRAAEAPNVD